MKKWISKLLVLVLLFLNCSMIIIGRAESIKSEQFQQEISDYIDMAMEQYHVPSLALTIVKDGNALFTQGYGVTELESDIKVDSSNSVFRVGSLSKILTSIAILQLAEDNKIDLNENVNNYLSRFKLEFYKDNVITIKHLLTHTAGLDYKSIGLMKDSNVTLEEFLINTFPPVIREPGVVTQYSNYGYALLGYIVEQVSKLPFHEYVSQNILQPLKMNNSSFLLNDDLQNKLVKAYDFRGDSYRVVEPYNIHCLPSGSLISSANDMSNLITAILQNGRYKNKAIYKESTANLILKGQYENYPNLLGRTYAFHQNHENGYTVLEHGGSYPPFMSYITIMPEKNIGIFITTNSTGGKKLILELVPKLYEYLADKKEIKQLEQEESFKTPISNYLGEYKDLRTPKKTVSFSYNSIEIKSIDENKLVVVDGSHQEIYNRVTDELFQNNSNKILAFKRSSKGNYFLCFSPNVMSTYEQMSSFESKYNSLIPISFYIAVLVALFICFSWPINKLRKKVYKTDKKTLAINRISSILMLAFTFCMIFYMSSISVSLPVNFTLILTISLALLFTALTLISLFNILSLWYLKKYSIDKRLSLTIMMLMNVGVVLFIERLNLLGFNF